MEGWNNGPHFLEFEPPDIFHCHVRAPIEAHQIEKTTRIIRENLEERRGIRIYFIAYMETPDSTFTPGARRVLSTRKVDWKGIAIVGGNSVFRAATNVMARSVYILWGRQMPFKMVKTPKQAREFIAELRAKEAAQAAAPKS